MNIRFSALSLSLLAPISPLLAGPVYPYGPHPAEKPPIPLSAAMNRLYDNYDARSPETNELFSNFKYTRLEGFDYHGDDGTVSRRDASKVIRVNGTYYVWYTRRVTDTPPRGRTGGDDAIPSSDWDLAEIWYATSVDGFTWKEQGVAVRRLPKPQAGWRSVATPDILIWRKKYYLYYQAYLEMPGTRGDFCPVSASVADSPDGPWTPANKVVIENGPPGSWDQFVIHDPYPLVFRGKIYLYYKSELAGGDDRRVRAQGVAIGDDPFGPFTKHPLNPVINSGHETSLFPFKEGIAAIVSRNGMENNTIQFAPDGVNFRIAAITALMPIAPGPYVPDAFTDTGDGRGITWGLCHFRNLGAGAGKSHSILARFDCDLSRDVNEPAFKESDTFSAPEVYFSFRLNAEMRKRRAADGAR